MNLPFVKSVKGISEVVGLDGIGAEVALFVTLNRRSETFQQHLEEYKDELEWELESKIERKRILKEMTTNAFIIVTYDTEIGEVFEANVDQNCESIFNGLSLSWEDTEKIRTFLAKKNLYDQHAIRRWERKGYMGDKFAYN